MVSSVGANGSQAGRIFSERSLGGDSQARRVLRLGGRVRPDDLPTIPSRYLSGLGGPAGTLTEVRLRARTGEIWCRVRSHPWSRAIRTIPLNGDQSLAPTPDALELRRGMRVECPGGRVGQVNGVAVNLRTGLATELLIRVRGDVDAEVGRPSDPLAPLLAVHGQSLLVNPAWAARIERVPRLIGSRAQLLLAATPAQIAHSLVVRGDAELIAQIWNILGANPAISPHLRHLSLTARDGDVTLLGSLPSPRHRLAAEQDIWHVPGVLSLRDEVSSGC
jgi:hypothetical protein